MVINCLFGAINTVWSFISMLVIHKTQIHLINNYILGTYSCCVYILPNFWWKMNKGTFFYTSSYACIVNSLKIFPVFGPWFVNPPFHWTAIPLRFEILVKMTWIVAETARAQKKRSRIALEAPCRSRIVSDFQILYIERIQKRNESVAPSPMS